MTIICNLLINKLLEVIYSPITSILAQSPPLVTKKVPFGHNEKANEKHEDGYLINGVHSLNAKPFGSIRVWLSEKIPSHFT